MKISVSKKGAVSVYGLRRFPITLYASEWEQILAKKEMILLFIEKHGSQLSSKGTDSEGSSDAIEL